MKNITDEPMIETKAFRLSKQEETLCKKARNLGSKKFANRAYKYDDEAIFPSENYQDLYNEGLLGICIPKKMVDWEQILDVIC